MSDDLPEPSTPARGVLGKPGRAVALTLACVSVVGSVVSFLCQDWFNAGVNPLGCFALGVTFLALYVSLRVFSFQEVQGGRQENRYRSLWERIEGTTDRAAADAAGANEGVARLISRLEQAFKSRDQAFPRDLLDRTPRLYRELTEADSGLIMWVDDDPEMVEWERAALSGAGIRSVWVATTDEALTLAEENDFDVVVTDMGRPEGRRAGYDLLDALRRRSDETPVLVYSSSKDPKHVAEVFEHRGQGATNNPFEIVELVASEVRRRR
jgi:CheY-like chemotaxis protein